MGPKKGKKAEKAPKLDEAKLAELRAMQKVEAKNELRRRLEDEAKISKVNSLKILNQWRKIMRLAKTEALKKDIEILSQNHERDVDRKDAILQMLDRDLEEAEEQYQMALRTHLTNIDNLLKLHDSRLYALERNFQKELQTLQTEFAQDKEVILAKFSREKRELAAIIDAIEQEEEGRNSEAKHAFEQLREEIRNRNLEEINMLRISLDAQIEELEQHFETAHLNYLSQTAQRTHDFKNLTRLDQKLSADIEKKKKKIDNLQTTIQHWRAKMRQLSRETEERNRLLLAEKHSIQKHYQQLKQRIKIYRSTQNQRLLHLSQSANLCKKVLNDKLENGRRVLSLHDLSRRMETLIEQILPFAPVEEPNEEIVYKDADQVSQNLLIHGGDPNAATTTTPATTTAAPSSPGKSAERLSISTRTSAPTAMSGQTKVVPHQSSSWTKESEHGEFVPTYDRLGNFYRKFNKILLDNVAIGKEKERLQLENAQLQDLIQQYLEGLQVNDHILSGDNPLLVINGRANLNHDPPVRKVKPTIQDAIQITATNARQQQPIGRY